MDILICGDMNGRCSNHLDETDHFHVERKSKEKVVNNYGKQLVTFYNNFNVHILNGYKCGDEQGEYTCITSTNKGLIDCIICSTNIYDWIKNCHVSYEDVTQLGIDHLPVCCLMHIRDVVNGGGGVRAKMITIIYMAIVLFRIQKKWKNTNNY